MSEPILHHVLTVDAATWRLLDPDGDEITFPGAFPEVEFNTTAIIAVEFKERTLREDLSWELSPCPLKTDEIYRISGSCAAESSGELMFQSSADTVNQPGEWPDGSTADPARGQLTFRIHPDLRHFYEIASDPEKRRRCVMFIEARRAEDSSFRTLARFGFRAAARPGGRGISGEVLFRTGTTVNGIGGPVVLADASGEPLTATGQTILLPKSNSGTQGPQGDPGPANSLVVGAVTTGEAGTMAKAEIIGESPRQILNLTIPRGDTGLQGDKGEQGPAGTDGAPGPANTLTIGTVTTGEPGTPASATISGESPSQTLNLTIPRGDTGATGAQGDPGDPNVAEEMVDAKISTHNSALNAHPMQFSGETDFNNLTQGGSFYLSAGGNLQNAPATGTFFVIIKNWTSGGITRIFQQVYRLQPDGVHRLYTRHGNKASGSSEITWSSWMMIGYNAFISAPNYGAGIDITSTLQQGVYAAPSAGWIYAIANGVSISGNLIGDMTQIVLPVAAGDTITADVVTMVKFYPNR